MPSVKSIAIFVWTPFVARDYARFGLDVLRSCFDVHVLDCTAWLSPSLIGKGQSHSVAWFPGYHEISSYGDFVDIVRQIDVGEQWAAIYYLGPTLAQIRLRRVMRMKGCLSITCNLGSIPTPQIGPAAKFCRGLEKIRPSHFGQLIAAMLSGFGHGDDFALVAGRKAAEGKLKAKNILKTYSFDYEKYQSSKLMSQVPPVARQPYIVYLDDGWAGDHPDFRHFAVTKRVRPSSFFPSLCAFFSEIERVLQRQVVIAGHPRISYGDSERRLFEGRPIYAGKTAELVKDADMVLAHSSTSISFAVLWRKPIAILTSDALKDNERAASLIEAFSSALAQTPISIDNHGEVSQFLLKGIPPVQENIYAAYEDTYIKEGPVNVQAIWEPLIQALNQEEEIRM